MTPTDARRLPKDSQLAGFDELLATTMPGPIAAVYEAAGSSVVSIEPIQATWRPARSLTVRYRIGAEGGGLEGSNDLVAVVGDIPEDVSVVERPDTAVGVWIVPDDPLLPGLRSALDAATVNQLLADLGSEDDVTFTRLRAYRPGRHAVVQVDAGSSSLFLKVVPPARITDLHEKHRFLANHLPVPDSLGLAPELGVVVMRALPGVDLRTALREGRSPLPSPGVIDALIAGLPAPQAGWRSRSPIETLPGIVELLSLLLPEEASRLDRLLADIGTETSKRDVPVHGDFHEAQILADGPRLMGLVDVDTFGWGRAGDDAATMLGHLHLLAPGCRLPSLALDFATDLNRHWDRSLDPVQLRLKTAAVVLGLATGPFRAQSENWPAETTSRIDMAEQWVESAHKVDERSLIATSATSHTDVGS